MNASHHHDLPQTVVDHAALRTAALPGLSHRTLADAAHGLQQLSVWQQSLAPGTASPPHRHDTEEVVLCHAGLGELHLRGQVHRFGPQTSVLIPRNEPHQIFSVGTEPLQITAVLATPTVEVYGPDEQRMALPW